jgi:alkylhydroperoxidase/carboxymuconolactone decarboxylase family protein YurZ
VTDHEDLLVRFAIRDGAAVDALLADERKNLAASHLDAKTHALARVAALVAIDAATPSYLDSVDEARRSGATDDEIVGTLVALLPVVGAARVVSAAPKLGLALGYDVGEALEGLGRAEAG